MMGLLKNIDIVFINFIIIIYFTSMFHHIRHLINASISINKLLHLYL